MLEQHIFLQILPQIGTIYEHKIPANLELQISPQIGTMFQTEFASNDG